ncbi:S8 family peptidase [Anaerovorax odorimutans]|uniref:S8 family peptidase n=1 Tax=Anaerovorax odorimutans TaxID=109327 RepID=UPI00040A73D4|nr:S8 family peptidase [Anaerovorax odorimutans]
MSENETNFTSVIIYSNRTISEIKDCIAKYYGHIKYELPFINAVAVEIPQENRKNIAHNKMISRIYDDVAVSKTPIYKLKQDISQGNSASTFYSSRGKGVGIAIIDTGVAPHYDLIKPINRIIAFKDFIGKKEIPYDDDGHGTHVAGIALGNGYSSRKYIGTSPCANLIAVKALDDMGNGTASDILAGLQWVINNRKRYNIKVINLSLGITVDENCEDDPLVKGAEAAVKHGITVIAAAGNNGPEKCTINSPGISPYVITVGATGFPPAVAKFSSKGPTHAGYIKPDLVAPGVDITSLSNKNPKGYAVQSGTSMATPIVSGVAACLYSSMPYLKPHEVKKILMKKCLPLKKESRNSQGHGLLNYEIFLNNS